MLTKYIEDHFAYDGSQLKSLFAYLKYGLLGDSIVAWRGACDIPFAHMVDGEDILAGSRICGRDMVHFIVEKFGTNLPNAVALQRLLTAIAGETLRRLELSAALLAKLRREGDDLFIDGRKLSISIATVSPVSALIHFAVNVTNEGTPVPTISLQDMQIEPGEFARQLMASFAEEMNSIADATHKVRPVSSL